MKNITFLKCSKHILYIQKMLRRSKIQRVDKKIEAKSKLNEKSSKKNITKDYTVKPSTTSDTDNMNNIPRFIQQLWKLVNNKEINNLVSWSAGGNTFVVKNQTGFEEEALPLYYRHNKIMSFIKSLTLYGFERIPSMKNRFVSSEIEFSHSYFKKNNPSLLKYFTTDKTYEKPVVTTKESDKHGKRCKKYPETSTTPSSVKVLVTLPHKRRTIILSRNRRRPPEGQSAESTIESNFAPPQGSVEDLFWDPIVGTSWQRVEEPTAEPPWELLTTPPQEHKPKDTPEQTPTVEIEFIDMSACGNGDDDPVAFNFGPDVEVVCEEEVSSTLDPDIEDCATSGVDIQDCSTSSVDIVDCSISVIDIEDCSTSAIEIESCSSPAFDIDMCSSSTFDMAVCSTPVHEIEPTEIDISTHDVMTNATVELIHMSDLDYSLSAESDQNYNLVDPIYVNDLTVLDEQVLLEDD